MRVTGLIKAPQISEADALPLTAPLAVAGRYNEALANARVLRSGEGRRRDLRVAGMRGPHQEAGTVSPLRRCSRWRALQVRCAERGRGLEQRRARGCGYLLAKGSQEAGRRNRRAWVGPLAVARGARRGQAENDDDDGLNLAAGQMPSHGHWRICCVVEVLRERERVDIASVERPLRKRRRERLLTAKDSEF